MEIQRTRKNKAVFKKINKAVYGPATLNVPNLL